VKINIEQITN